MRQQLTDFIGQSQVKEVIFGSQIFSHAARLHSLALVAAAMQQINQPQPVAELVG
jgi:hypothetical protein